MSDDRLRSLCGSEATNQKLAKAISPILSEFMSFEQLFKLIPETQQERVLFKITETLDKTTLIKLASLGILGSLSGVTHTSEEAVIEMQPSKTKTKQSSKVPSLSQMSSNFCKDKHEIVASLLPIINQGPIYPKVCSVPGCNLCISWALTTPLTPCHTCTEYCAASGWFPHYESATKTLTTAHFKKFITCINKTTKDDYNTRRLLDFDLGDTLTSMPKLGAMLGILKSSHSYSSKLPAVPAKTTATSDLQIRDRGLQSGGDAGEAKVQPTAVQTKSTSIKQTKKRGRKQCDTSASDTSSVTSAATLKSRRTSEEGRKLTAKKQDALMQKFISEGIDSQTAWIMSQGSAVYPSSPLFEDVG